MAKLVSLVCLSALFVAGLCDVIRNPDVTVAEIIEEIGPEFLDIIGRAFDSAKSNSNLDPLDVCDEPVEGDVEFLLHTRQYQQNPIRLETRQLSQVDPNKKVIVLIHGWVSGPFGYGFPKLIDAYLRRYDANVIMVDWTKHAWKAYPTSVCELPKVARLVGDFLCTLTKQLSIPLSSVHLVGHSLGGQMSGLIGQHLQEKCQGSLGRITALDPARPLFQGRPESERVDSSDALFVDVMHTNQLELGYYGDCGHVDYYVNCGIFQLGCEAFPDTEDITKLPLTAVFCEHLRALDYMAESISTERFKSKSCGSCPSLCVADIFFATYISMGEDCDENARGAYYITTNSAAPFAKGQDD